MASSVRSRCAISPSGMRRPWSTESGIFKLIPMPHNTALWRPKATCGQHRHAKPTHALNSPFAVECERPLSFTAARPFEQPTVGSLKWRDDDAAFVDGQPIKCVIDTDLAEMLLFRRHVQRADQHETREMRRGPCERAAAELREGVMTAVGCAY